MSYNRWNDLAAMDTISTSSAPPSGGRFADFVADMEGYVVRRHVQRSIPVKWCRVFLSTLRPVEGRLVHVRVEAERGCRHTRHLHAGYVKARIAPVV